MSKSDRKVIETSTLNKLSADLSIVPSRDGNEVPNLFTISCKAQGTYNCYGQFVRNLDCEVSRNKLQAINLFYKTKLKTKFNTISFNTRMQIHRTGLKL